MKQVGALSIQASNLHQANMLQQVVNQQSDFKQNIKSTVDEQVKDSVLDTLAQYSQELVIDETEPDLQANNTTQQPSSEVSMLLQLMKELNNKVDRLVPPKPPKKNFTIDPKTSKPYRRYFHSCGCCDHWGKHCKNKKPGNQDNATFNNRMGGSNFNCLPIRK